jgi:hypothetical protein
MTKLPNFFLAGAPKAGTTALRHYLDQHPEIYMSPVKEPNFFAEELRLENFSDHFRKLSEARAPAHGPISEWTDYVKLFEGARDEKAIGEASVSYFWSRNAARAISTKIAGAKILAVLRNPVERALSQFSHMLSFAETSLSFSKYLDRAMQSRDTRISEYYPFLNYGLYGEQLKCYREFFDADRIQIHLYEDFRNEPNRVLHEIFRFLEVDPEFKPDLAVRHMESAVPRSYFLKNTLDRLGIREALREKLPPEVRRYVRKATLRPREVLTMTHDDHARLVDFYREDIGVLSESLGRDLSSWLATYQTGARTGRR